MPCGGRNRPPRTELPPEQPPAPAPSQAAPATRGKEEPLEERSVGAPVGMPALDSFILKWTQPESGKGAARAAKSSPRGNTREGVLEDGARSPGTHLGPITPESCLRKGTGRPLERPPCGELPSGQEPEAQLRGQPWTGPMGPVGRISRALGLDRA